jgi:CheY-like chemotaxis protein
VYGIVAQHHGWIDLYSELGHGTTFRIYFPEARGGLEHAPLVQAETEIHGAATVLLVEDQDGLRALAEEVLTEAGCRVLSAPNGRAALKLAEKHLEDIDLLITDVVMPEMNGPELAGGLSRLWPGLRVLFVSGYSGDALLNRGTLENGTAFLQKPFAPSALRMKVAGLLRNREVPKG